MKIYLVSCPCCKPHQWHIFDNKDNAASHAENRKEYEQNGILN